MSYAIMEPYKPDIGLAIPPLSRNDIPVALRKTFTDKQYAAALVDFKKRAQEDYYSEWFWFTRSQQAWVNTWNATDEKEGAVEYPSPFMTFIQWIEGWLGGVITENPIFQAFPGRWQAAILSTFGMVALPPFEFVGFAQGKTETIKTSMPNALHFRRGVSFRPSQSPRSLDNADLQKDTKLHRPRHGVPDPYPSPRFRPHAARLQHRPTRLVGHH